MPVVEQTRVVPFRAEQMFDLVTDVKHYPEFLPWCVAARIRDQSDAHMIADLVIGFQVIRERFTSHVRLTVLRSGLIRRWSTACSCI